MLEWRAILASGVLVSLTGTLHEGLGFSWAKSWLIVMSIIGASLALLGGWHLRTLPVGDVSPLRGGGFAGAARSLGATWSSFFRKRDIWLMLAVCFFYRFGEGFIERFGSLFLLDGRELGGLGLNNVAVGHIYGTVGTIGFIAGSFVGGFLAAKLTLRRAFFILALALNLPHLTYYVLALWMPVDPWVIGAIVTVEKFGFGVGAVGHMLYMMQQISPGDFRMSHYAFATGVMALTKWFTGSISGWVYGLFGHNYQHFFLFVLVASIPPLVFAWIAPFPLKTSDEEKPAAAGH